MPPTDPKSSNTTALGFDEFIGILVAFATMGAIMFWSFSRRDSGWNLNGLLSPSPTSAPSVLPNLDSSSTSVQPNTGLQPFPVPAVEATETPYPIDEATPQVVLPPLFNIAPTQLPRKVQAPLPSSDRTMTTEQYRVVTPAEKLPTIPPPIAFTDIPDDFWGRRFIDPLSSRGVIKGFPDYSFRPNQPVNRAEFAAIVQQAFDKEVRNTAIVFKDVPTKFWATPAIDQAISNGFLKGYPDKIFKPEQKISRVQVLVALASGLNLKVPSDPASVLSIYKDGKDIPKYATNKVAAATANNLVVNHQDPQVFAPNKEATRAEVAAMVHQALVRMGRLQPIQSQNIVRVAR